MKNRDEELYERYCMGGLTGDDLSDIYRARSIAAMVEEFTLQLRELCAKTQEESEAFDSSSQKR